MGITARQREKSTPDSLLFLFFGEPRKATAVPRNGLSDARRGAEVPALGGLRLQREQGSALLLLQPDSRSKKGKKES